MIIDCFPKIVRPAHPVDSKTGHYISTVAYRASLSRHRTATVGFENVAYTWPADIHHHALESRLPDYHNLHSGYSAYFRGIPL